MGGRIVRLAAARRLERMRRAHIVRAVADQAVRDVGGANAVLVAGHKARLLRLPGDERQLWAEVEAELARRLGFSWWWGEEDAG